MKKLLSLLLACALLCGCAQNNTNTDVTTTTEEQNSAKPYDITEYDYSVYSEEITYNSNPDVSFKPLPGAYDLADGFVPYSTSDLMIDAYGVVVVSIKAKTDPLKIETTEYEVDKETGSFVEVPVTYEIPVYEAEVIKSLGGGHNEGDTIRISTYLEGYGIKFSEGKDYIVITYENKFEDERGVYYPPNCMIHGVFEIKEDYTVVAQSALSVSAKYDGLSLADVAHDFENAFEKVAKEKTE